MAKWELFDAEKLRENLTKQQEDEISLLYRKVYLETRKTAMAIPKDGTTSQQIEKQYLTKLQKELDAAYKSLGVGLEKEIKKNAQKAAQGVADETEKLIKKAGFDIKGAFSYVPKDTVAAIATGQVYKGNWSLSASIWTDVQHKQADINKIVAEGVAGNKSAYEIAKSLEQYVDPSAKKPWDWSKVYPGTAKKIDYNAQRLARTMVSHAYQQSLERTCKNNPFVSGYIWQAGHSTRVCPICADRDGQFFKKGELPLDHPNGLCTFIPQTEDLEAVADRLGDWVQGKEDAELDNWMSAINGGKVSEPKFNDLQNQWLSPLGYSPGNMPKDFTEFATALTYEQQTQFLHLAGADWSNPHPFQAMEKYYNQNLASVHTEIKPKTTKTTMPGPPDPKTWIASMRTQTESEMLKMEATATAKMTETQRHGIKTYSGSAYTTMNSYLRLKAGGMSEEEARQQSYISDNLIQEIKNAQNGLKKASLERDLVLRRGTDLGDLAGLMPGDFWQNKAELRGKTVEELNKMLSGTVGTYAGFTSTSSLYERGFSGNVECIIRAPKGTAASSIMSISKFGTSEGETLLNAGTKVRVLSIEDSDGHMGSSIRVFMEIINK